ncbi:LacI family transcriptional regulator [Aquibacillus sp. 3ASR75-11]|uniref:LacI family transcriptional regulator n=1 Tax=Terrihalobacillus insolitus TaxID=2950438 RepID=A0A9X3WUV5_9BACI|nr:LacI family DNA-binding transcriptional regulator [Terrihalobacillus insolitus]MDC3412699.1 LacI family transcriptional regulator [Terrihalobacillus insolitus]MDC3423824.1 LacI family transcriptional regulator [Terrihalobacillus insolitus]
MATIKEIADMANVSRTTVSRVLNDSGYVSKDVRQRIMKVIEETGYVPSEHAKSLRTKKTKVIGVILPKISTETSSRLVAGIDDILSEKGYQILLANTNLDQEKELEFIKLLKVRQVDGIILTATNVNERLVQQINKTDIPLIVIGQEVDSVSNVLYDDYHAARAVVSLFIQKGHEAISFIGVDESDVAVGHLRKKGYIDEMTQHGLTVEDTWIQKGIFDIESGYEAMKKIIETSTHTPTAIFAVTDRLAVGAINYLKEKGYQIPEDMAIAGIGASEISQYVNPPLTTVDYQNEAAGKAAAKLLIESIETNKKEPKKITLDYRLLVRDSV